MTPFTQVHVMSATIPRVILFYFNQLSHFWGPLLGFLPFKFVGPVPCPIMDMYRAEPE